MSPLRNALVACFAAACLLAMEPARAAPSGGQPSGSVPGARPPGGHAGHQGQRPGYSGGSRHYGSSGHYGHGHHYGNSYWGWGLGLSLAVPLGLGWYEPNWWGPAYSPYYAYGPAYGAYGYPCGADDDCWRAQMAQGQPAPDTTVVPPPAPGEYGGPTQRPLHLNYCDSARAWFPHVRTCPGGWRLVLPEYGTAP